MKKLKIILHIIALVISAGIPILAVRSLPEFPAEVPEETVATIKFIIGFPMFFFLWGPLTIGMGVSPLLRKKNATWRWEDAYNHNWTTANNRQTFWKILNTNFKLMSIGYVILFSIVNTFFNLIAGATIFQAFSNALLEILVLIFYFLAMMGIGWCIMYLINRKDYRLPL